MVGKRTESNVVDVNDENDNRELVDDIKHQTLQQEDIEHMRKSGVSGHAIVQELAARFKAENGSITCADMLGLKRDVPVSNEAEPRTTEYYAKRPCPKIIEGAARIIADYLETVGR